MPYLISYVSWNGPKINIGSKVVKNLLPYQELADSVCPEKGAVIISINKLSEKEAQIIGAK